MSDAKDQHTITSDHGRTLASWAFSAVASHQRGRRWYLAMGVVGALMAISGFWSGNYVFVLLLVLFALTFYLVGRHPQAVRCTVSVDGVTVGRTFYPYGELKCFWIIYQPPEVKTLYLEFTNLLKPRLPIPLEDQNPVSIRHYLMDYIPEDLNQQEEPVWDQISRILKL